jgi:hypothetical protein
MKSKQTTKVIALIIFVICVIAIAISAWFFLGSFDSSKQVLDSLASDGELESFTPKVYRLLRQIAIVPGFLAAFTIGCFIFFRQKLYTTIQNTINWLTGIKSLGQDSKTFFSDLKHSIPEKTDLVILLCLIILGAVLRALLSSLPMGHDESYTYIVFARRDLGMIIKDYHLPNNHVFHSILVHFSTQLFGSQPWAIRFPAMLSVLGLVPVSYLVGRNYFRREVALLTSAAVAILPDFILTSVNARGYPVVAFIFFLIWAFAIYLKKKNNLLAWLLFILISALGFFTLPMTLYAFGTVIGWLFVSWLLSDVSSEYPRWVFLRSLFLSGLAVVILTLLLYTPIFLNNGFGALFSNSIIQGMKVDNLNLLSEDLFSRVGRAWSAWHTGFSPWVGYLSLFGVSWAWLRFRKISPHTISTLGLGLLWILALLVIQMVVGWVRIWFFLAPIYFLYAFAGWVDIIDQLSKLISKKNYPWVAAGLVTLLLLVSSADWWFTDSRYDQLLKGSKPHTQLAAEFIAESSQETDLITVISPDSPIIWYYGLNLGIEMSRFNLNSGTEFTHALLLVNTAHGQTVKTLLDSKSLLVSSPDLIELIFETGPMEIYYAPITNLTP